MNKRFWLLTSLILLFGLWLFAGSVSHAAEEGKGSLSLHYVYQDTALDGVKVRIYRVAELDRDGTCHLIKPYSTEVSFPITNLNRITDSSQWNRLITPVSAYIYTYKINPDAAGTTANGGNVKFDNLTLGIYLVIADPLEVPSESCIYSFNSFYTAIPSLDDKGVWHADVLDVVGIPKCEKTTVPASYDYAVYKRWNDYGYESLRPSYIIIHIYKDGIHYATQTLSPANNWSYSWTYEPGHTWAISEEADFSKYTLDIVTSGRIFYLYNSHRSEEGEVLGESREPEVKGADRLPQTGQLWWPIPLLILAGLFCMILGIRMLRTEAGKRDSR